jgi:hypothetical protein
MNEHSLTTENSISAVFVNNKNTITVLDTKKNVVKLITRSKTTLLVRYGFRSGYRDNKDTNVNDTAFYGTY